MEPILIKGFKSIGCLVIYCIKASKEDDEAHLSKGVVV